MNSLRLATNTVRRLNEVTHFIHSSAAALRETSLLVTAWHGNRGLRVPRWLTPPAPHIFIPAVCAFEQCGTCIWGIHKQLFFSSDTAEAPKLSSLSVLAQCGSRVAAWPSCGIAGRQRSHHEHQPTESKDINADLRLALWPNGTLQHTQSRTQIPEPRERRADPLQECEYTLKWPRIWSFKTDTKHFQNLFELKSHLCKRNVPLLQP